MRRLYRSNTQKILGGVCGGLAEYFDVDVTLIRLLWVMAIIVGGAGAMVYIIAWIIIPEYPRMETAAVGDNSTSEEVVVNDDFETAASPKNEKEGNAKKNSLAGIILIVLGVLFLLHEFFPFWQMRRYWPIILIAAGIIFILRGLRGE